MSLCENSNKYFFQPMRAGNKKFIAVLDLDELTMYHKAVLLLNSQMCIIGGEPSWVRMKEEQ